MLLDYRNDIFCGPLAVCGCVRICYFIRVMACTFLSIYSEQFHLTFIFILSRFNILMFMNSFVRLSQNIHLFVFHSLSPLTTNTHFLRSGIILFNFHSFLFKFVFLFPSTLYFLLEMLISRVKVFRCFEI